MSELHAGVARTNITPPLGMLMSGYGGRRTGAVGVHDELHTAVLYLAQDDTEVAVVTLDILDTDFAGATHVRAACEAASNIFVACSHTHGGPLTGLYRAMLDDPLRQSYTETLVNKIAGTLEAARRNAVPVRVGYGEQDCAVAMNRREQKPDGKIVLGVNPGGPTDPVVRVVRFDYADTGTPLAMLFSYACHGTTLGGDNLLFTADYAGVAKRFVDAQFPGVVSLFLAGCSGDINPYPRGTFADCERNGKRLGCAAVQAALETDPLAEGSALAVRSEFCSVPLMEEISPAQARERLAQARADADREVEDARAKAGGEPASEQMVLNWLTARRLGGAQALVEALETGEAEFAIPMEVQAIAVGELALVGLPGEVFVEIGMQIAEQSPFAHTLHVSHANGSAGYIPTADEVPKGGYEVESARAHRYGIHAVPEADEILIRTALKALEGC